MKKTILISAYAVNPYKGSEDGIAWNIIKQLARHNKIIAITRKNNRPAIDQYLAENPLSTDATLNFAYYDMPYWMRFWKRGGRGALLYHYLWHFALIFFIKKQKFQFDIAHHLNFNNDWTPSFLWLLGKPFVWGPIGHHPRIPFSYAKQYGYKTVLLETLKWLVKKCFWAFDPFLKITKWKAAKIIALNSSVQKVLNVKSNKIVIIPAAGNEKSTIKRKATQKFTILSIGRLVPLKGFDITLNAFAKFYWGLPKEQRKNTQLVLIGKGPQKEYIDHLIQKNKLPKEIVLFKDWMDREALQQYYSASHLFLFPSHEGAGMVVPEALSYGLPVLCFDNIGPGELMDKTCGISLPYTDYEQSIQGFSEALNRLFFNKELRQTYAKNAIQRFDDCFTWEKKGLRIQEIYEQLFNTLPVQIPPSNRKLLAAKFFLATD